jgi:hypothetical protein
MADLGMLTRQCPMFEIGHRGEGIDGADTIDGEREIVRIHVLVNLLGALLQRPARARAGWPP